MTWSLLSAVPCQKQHRVLMLMFLDTCIVGLQTGAPKWGDWEGRNPPPEFGVDKSGGLNPLDFERFKKI